MDGGPESTMYYIMGIEGVNPYKTKRGAVRRPELFPYKVEI